MANTYTKEQIEAMQYGGYIRGEYFTGEWANGGDMSGYGIFYCEDGAISPHGDFSESGELCDRVDAGGCIEAINERGFELLAGVKR